MSDLNEPALPERLPATTPYAMMPYDAAAAALAAQAKAQVEARYVMAMRQPRSPDHVRELLLAECRRPAFAQNKSTYYRKPIGQGVEGLGIRFVEVALRCMTNVLIESTMIIEDETKEIHRVSVTDLEANVTYPMDVIVRKTVERSRPDEDGAFISVRTNSYGKSVYTVTASDEDLLNKRGALISKAIRTLGLRIIPGDLQDEAEEVIRSVRLDRAAKDPNAERKAIADAFSELSVSVLDLERYLGHGIGQCSPAELVDLRAIYGAIRDGEASWKQVMDNKAEGGEPEGEKAPRVRQPKAKEPEQSNATAAAPSPQPPEQAPASPASPRPSEAARPAEQAQAAPPAAVAPHDAALTGAQLAFLRKKIAQAGKSEADLAEHFGIETIDDMRFSQLNPAHRWLTEGK